MGDDELSLYTIAALQREGVDGSAIRRQPGAGPIHSVVLVDLSTGQRTVLHNSARVVPPRISDYADVITQCRVLFVDSTITDFAHEATPLAQQAGVQVVADLERAPTDDALALGRRVDHLIVCDAYAARATGESAPADMVRALRSPTHVACVVTAGEQGSWYTTREMGDEVRHFPALRVQAVDTTGCGDVFHGAYAAAIAWGRGVVEALAIATATAGLKATRPGGRNGIPSRAEVENILASRPFSAQPDAV